MERNSLVKHLVAAGATTSFRGCGNIPFMAKSEQGQHYFRQYRERKGISLRKLAGLLATGPDGKPVIDYSSLSRIEKGEQPFSEPILNAVANALGVHRIMLLEIDPTKDSQMADMLDKLDDKGRAEAIRVWIELIASRAA